MTLKPGHAVRDEIAIIYQDNHVVWRPLAEAENALRAQTGRSLSELVQTAERGELTAHSIEHRVRRE